MERASKPPSARSPLHVTREVPQLLRPHSLAAPEPQCAGRRVRLGGVGALLGLGAQSWFVSGDSCGHAANSLLCLRNGGSAAGLLPRCKPHVLGLRGTEPGVAGR